MNRLLLTALVVLVGCSKPTGSFKGKLVSGPTAAPIPNVIIQLKANPLPPDVACQMLQATSGADGAFEVANLCADISYVLSTKSDKLGLMYVPPIKGGVMAAAPVEIKAWPVPRDSGVFRMDGEDLIPLRQSAQIGVAKIQNSKEEALFPVTYPENPTWILPGGWLVLAGERTISEYKFFPLIWSGARTFASETGTKKSEAWPYIGIKFATDTEFTRLVEQPKEGAFVDVTAGKMKLRFIKPEALPAYWYAIMSSKAIMTYIVGISPNGEKFPLEKPPTG